MAADWEEVKRLAADFQKAQLGSTIQKLSERNCIEIVKKLIELKLIDVIFTNDGKEYLTPQRLQKEIIDELIVRGGRVNLTDLPQIIGVDFGHIVTKATEFSRREPDVHFLLDQLITREYLDHLAEEVNEKLQRAGQITIAELTKQYDLPGDFLEENIHERLGSIIQGHADSKDSRTIFTDSYVAQHKARIQGVLSALTRPVPVATLINHFKFPERLFFSVAENLIKDGRLAGSLFGGKSSERALYIPNLYAKSQSEWVDAFYKQNGYLEYDSLLRLGIPDPKNYIIKRYKNEPLTFLCSCCVGKTILNQVEATIDEALNTGSWVDVMPLLPSVFNVEDCQQVIAATIRSLPKPSPTLRIFCNSVILSEALISTILDVFEPMMNKKAHEDIIKRPEYFAAPHLAARGTSKKEETGTRNRADKKEERKKKGGKAGGGTQGRETKVRSVKKKYHTAKGGEDTGSDEDTPDSSMKENRHMDLEFMSIAEIKNKLEEIPSLSECPECLISALAEDFHGPLAKKYQDVAKSIYITVVVSSGTSRRKLHAEFQEKVNSLLNHIHMFEKGIKLFSEDVSTQLYKHTLKTLCTDITNMCVNYLAGEHGVCTETDVYTDLSAEARLKVIKMLPQDIRQQVTKLNGSLTAKNLEDFETNVEAVLGAGICDVIIRKPDKKKERLLLSSRRESLLTQLSETTDPALCLHLAVLLIFQTQTQNMLHASGKFVPQIISFLQKHIPFEIYKSLAENQELVMQSLIAAENTEEVEKADVALKELIPKIKDIATSHKKGFVSEAQ